MIDGKGGYEKRGNPLSARNQNDLIRRIERLESIESRTLKITKTGTSIHIDARSASTIPRFQVYMADAGYTQLSFVVGPRRGDVDTTYPHSPDTIYIVDREDDVIFSIVKDAKETITDTIADEGCLYYEIVKDAGTSEWTATLKISDTLPDFATFAERTLFLPLATFRYDSGSSIATYLTQELHHNPVLFYAANITDKLKADELWIHLETVDGVTEIQHIHPGESEYEGSFWVAGSSGGATTTELKYDKNGHLTIASGPDTNYLYRECNGTQEFINDVQLTPTVFGYNDICWEYIGTTNQVDDTQIDDVDVTSYATCSACEGDFASEIWRDCDPPNSIIAYIADGTVTDDYAWVCSSSLWVKCYNDGGSLATPTTPSTLEQPGTAPTNCAGLVGWELQDSYDGAGESSSTTSSDYYVARYTELNVPSKGTVAISGSKLVLASTISGNLEHGVTSRISVAHTGDFEMVLDWVIDSWFATSSTFIYQPLWYVDTASGTYAMYRGYNGASNLGTCFNGPSWSSGCSTTGVLSNDTGKWRIRRVSGTIYGDYWNGSSWTNFKSGSDSGAVGLIAIRVHTEGSFTGTLQCSINSMTAIDGSSNPLICDPTGKACT